MHCLLTHIMYTVYMYMYMIPTYCGDRTWYHGNVECAFATPSFSVSLAYFNLAVHMRNFSGDHSCMSDLHRMVEHTNHCLGYHRLPGVGFGVSYHHLCYYPALLAAIETRFSSTHANPG